MPDNRLTRTAAVFAGLGSTVFLFAAMAATPWQPGHHAVGHVRRHRADGPVRSRGRHGVGALRERIGG